MTKKKTLNQLDLQFEIIDIINNAYYTIFAIHVDDIFDSLKDKFSITAFSEYEKHQMMYIIGILEESSLIRKPVIGLSFYRIDTNQYDKILKHWKSFIEIKSYYDGYI